MDIEAVKRSIIVVVAGNEQSNWHIIKRFNEKGVKFMATAMKYCDYSFYIPGCKELGIEESIFFWDKVAIERKAHLTEIAGNFCKGRTRFETEFTKALSDGCKVTLLIEDEKAKDKMKLRREMDRCSEYDLDTKYRKTWRTDFKGESMIGSIKAFKDRYNLDLVFCKKVKTADVMLDVFYKAVEEYFAEVS